MPAIATVRETRSVRGSETEWRKREGRERERKRDKEIKRERERNRHCGEATLDTHALRKDLLHKKKKTVAKASRRASEDTILIFKLPTTHLYALYLGRKCICFRSAVAWQHTLANVYALPSEESDEKDFHGPCLRNVLDFSHSNEAAVKSCEKKRTRCKFK